MRELSGRLLMAFVSCLILASIFGYVAHSITNGNVERFDDAIIQPVQGVETPWLTEVMKVFTFIGSTNIVLAISIITIGILLYFRQGAQTILFTVAIGGTALLNLSLKLFFQRDRPDFNRLIEISGYSFPSGHTMMATSLYVILAIILWRNTQRLWRVVVVVGMLFMIFMICISRIYLGVHYPSDIVGGVTASSFWIIIVTTIYTIILNKQKQQAHSTIQM